MAYNDPDGAGVGGWLAFLVLVLAVFTPLGIVVSTAIDLYGDDLVAASLGDAWPMVEAIEWGISGAAVAGSLYLAWRLNYVHVWQTVRIVIPGLWLISVGSMALELTAISWITGYPLGLILEGIGPSVARPFVFSAIWTACLLRSRRVANTYVRHDAPEEVAQVFE